jgi:hypothetical protein
MDTNKTKKPKKSKSKSKKKKQLPEGMEKGIWTVMKSLRDITEEINKYINEGKEVPIDLINRKAHYKLNMQFLSENTDIYSSDESEAEPSDDEDKPLHISPERKERIRERKPLKISRVIKEKGFGFIRLYTREEAKEDFYNACELAKRYQINILDIEQEYEQLKENDLYPDACSLDDRLLSELSLDELIDEFVYPVYKRIADDHGIEMVEEYFMSNHK